MAKYVLVYTGGGQPESEEAQAAVMAAWMGWFEKLGPAVVDGGDPFSGKVMSISGGEVSDMPVGEMATGYSILEADSMESAVRMARDCPILSDGGQVTVYETYPIM